MGHWRGLWRHARSKGSESPASAFSSLRREIWRWKPFLAGLRDLGWVEGENIHVEYRDAGDDDGRLPALAAELVALDVDVLVTATFQGILAAHRATAKIPTVMITGPDLVSIGLAASMAHPGGNITGQTVFLTELADPISRPGKQRVHDRERIVRISHEQMIVLDAG